MLETCAQSLCVFLTCKIMLAVLCRISMLEGPRSTSPWLQHLYIESKLKKHQLLSLTSRNLQASTNKSQVRESLFSVPNHSKVVEETPIPISKLCRYSESCLVTFYTPPRKMKMRQSWPSPKAQPLSKGSWFRANKAKLQRKLGRAKPKNLPKDEEPLQLQPSQCLLR